MKIHKEGRTILLILFCFIAIVNGVVFLLDNHVAFIVTLSLSAVIFLFFTFFFRINNRTILADENFVIAPADGRIVVIEPVMEDEILHAKCMQVSIFMSVFSMHANWFPIGGKVLHVSHQAGRKMAAYLPKSSRENERSSVVIEAPNGQHILVRQVAGALARRIVTYAKEGENCSINRQMGFIKFGSRVDLYLPMDAEIFVENDDETVGNETIIAKLKHE
ncbi:MAG: phosphatidylserine decarboxylase family protein [Paludibacteraceae bacterium]|nr:phosphatidylserine decarboxylase family protein [Paludibacteraceae bacterium]